MLIGSSGERNVGAFIVDGVIVGSSIKIDGRCENRLSLSGCGALWARRAAEGSTLVGAVLLNPALNNMLSIYSFCGTQSSDISSASGAKQPRDDFAS